MDEQFDKKLSGRIREVFDNYESPPADEAWLELRKKFPVKEERKVAWLWWSSAAAVLLVFLGVGLWLMNKKPQDAGNIAVKPKTQLQPKQAAPATAPEGGQIAKVTPSAINPVAGDSATQSHNGIAPRPGVITANPYVADNGRTPGDGNKGIAPGKVAVVKGSNPAIDNDNTANVNAGQQLPGNTAIANTTVPTGQTAGSDTKTNSQQQVAAVDVPVVSNGQSTLAVTNKTNPVVVQQPAKTMEDLFKQDKTQQIARKTEKKELKKVNFSVYAATYLNYAEGSANQVNAGAGFTSDIRLSKNVKLSTGVSLAQNTLSYAGQPPVSGGSSRMLTAAAPSVSSDVNVAFGSTATVAQLQNYSASLVGLDVPINIKYEFNPDKTDTYISAGLSSGTFIDERYTSRYAYTNNSLGNSTVITQNQTATQSFGSFYFGKTLNVSFGTGFPIGKSNRLVVEPFLKYPLGGLGAQAIHFGAGGVNLKFNFKATKK